MRAELQIYLKAMPSAAEVAGTESLDYGLTMETLVFPAYPIGKHHVQVAHNLDKYPTEFETSLTCLGYGIGSRAVWTITTGTSTLLRGNPPQKGTSVHFCLVRHFRHFP